MRERRVKAHIKGSPGSIRQPQQERARLTVEAILEAAGLILAESGYASATTNGIARRAGVSIGSLYQYFPNKEAIYLAILERHQDEMKPLTRQALANMAAGLPLGEVLGGVLKRSLAVHEADPALMLAIHGELGGLAQEHGLEEMEGAEQAVRAIADSITERPDLPSDLAGEKAWLVLTILDAVGHGLVHKPLTGLDREALMKLTVDACRSFLEAN